MNRLKAAFAVILPAALLAMSAPASTRQSDAGWCIGGACGLPALLQTLQAMNSEDSGLALMFKTHPAPAERLDALEKLQSLLDAYAAQPQLAERFLASARAKR